jgi:predicted phosphodiesterase
MLLHVSDIHARPGPDLATLAESIAKAVAPYGCPSHLVASGDFGFQGQHTNMGARFVRQLADRVGVAPAHIVCCPGNHDIAPNANGKPTMEAYHKEISTLLKDAGRAEPVRARLYEDGAATFLVLNSAYLMNWRYGHIDTAAVQGINLPEKSDFRIAVVHHHCIPFEDEDRSHISNAYPLLTYLEKHRFDALLHGHRHMAMTLRLHTLHVIGAGSINYPPTANLNNQFTLIEPGKSVRRFRFIADITSATGGHGDWVCQQESW